MSNIGIRNLILTHTDKDGIFQNFSEHFKFKEIIDDSGTQGRVGLLTHGKELIIFKIPRSPGFSIRHEQSIMSRLNGSRKYIPYYCESFGLLKTYVSFDSDNPFDVSSNPSAILCDILLSEYIEDSVTFTSRIYPENTKVVYSLIRQVLLAIEIGRMKYGLVHYDLHTDNLLLRKCPKNSLFLYNLGERKFLLPTYGVYPIMIDFGFSYLKGMSNQPLYSQMSHTDAGYLSCLFDPYYDARIFLMNVSSDLIDCRTQREKSFREKILAIYNHLNIDTTKGWDITKGRYSASEMIVYTIQEIEDEKIKNKEKGWKSKSFFNSNSYDCINIFQSLIILPLKNTKNGDFRPYYKLFISQFKPIEKSVKSSNNKLLLLTQLTESARKFRYIQNWEECVMAFKNDYLNNIDKSLKFYQAPETDYASLLDSMYKMADCIGTVYFRVMGNILKNKKDQYKTLQPSNLDIYDVIDVYYSTGYKLSPTTPVYIWDIETETSRRVDKFDEEFCEIFNDTVNRNRATLLWDHCEESL